MFSIQHDPWLILAHVDPRVDLMTHSVMKLERISQPYFRGKAMLLYMYLSFTAMELCDLPYSSSKKSL